LTRVKAMRGGAQWNGISSAVTRSPPIEGDIMSTTFATRDEAAADRIRAHHAHMAADLERLVDAVASSADEDFDGARATLVRWLRTELAPHAAGEEQTFYPAAAGTEAGRLLIAGMTAEHGVILGLVDQVDRAETQAVAAAWAGALLRVFAGHAEKENDLVLPLLVAEPHIDLAALLEEMHSAH
jgi:hypothetical protein